jgi:SAM-dependent methyltransferase
VSPALSAVEATAPFDSVAAEYDARFTETRLGRWVRQRVWATLGDVFPAGSHVLELGCGTGEDAVWLARRGVRVLATDISRAMLERCAAKARAAGVADRVELAHMDAANLRAAGMFDGAFSNFGPLNCVADRVALGHQLGACIRRGGMLVAVVMGPYCAWETAWYLAHADPRRAFRRAREGGLAQVGSERMRVWYPSPRRLARELAPDFRVLDTMGIGAVLPPSYLAHLVDRWPGVFARLSAVDRKVPLAPWWADHYLMVLERR